MLYYYSTLANDNINNDNNDRPLQFNTYILKFNVFFLFYRAFVEAGFDFNHAKLANGNILTKMFECSPISHIDKVKTPILFLVGKFDRRAAPSQSYIYHKKLLARGIETKCVDFFI